MHAKATCPAAVIQKKALHLLRHWDGQQGQAQGILQDTLRSDQVNDGYVYCHS